MATPDVRQVVAEHEQRGNTPILSGTSSGVDVQYPDTERELVEVFSHLPEALTHLGAEVRHFIKQDDSFCVIQCEKPPVRLPPLTRKNTAPSAQGRG